MATKSNIVFLHDAFNFDQNTTELDNHDTKNQYAPSSSSTLPGLSLYNTLVNDLFNTGQLEYLQSTLVSSLNTTYQTAVDRFSSQVADAITQWTRVTNRHTLETMTDDLSMKALDLLKRSPNGYHTSYEVMKTLVATYCTEGNAILFITRDGVTPVRLDLMNAIIPSPPTTKNFNTVEYSGYPTWSSAPSLVHATGDQVAHFRWLCSTNEGTQSLFVPSNRSKLRHILDVAHRSSEYYRKIVARNPQSQFALIDKDEIQDDDVSKDMVESTAKYLRSDNASSPLWYNRDVDIIKLMRPEDARGVLEFMQHAEYKILEFYSQGANSPNYNAAVKSAEDIPKKMLKSGVRSHIVNFLDLLSLRLFNTPGDPRKFEYSDIGLMRGNSDDLLEMYKLRGTLQTTSDLTQKEYRHLWGLDIKGDDEMKFMKLNDKGKIYNGQ